jgi:hypothetical protein
MIEVILWILAYLVVGLVVLVGANRRMPFDKGDEFIMWFIFLGWPLLTILGGLVAIIDGFQWFEDWFKEVNWERFWQRVSYPLIKLCVLTRKKGA